MCGIAGVVGQRDEDLTADICDSLRHRGPDDEGFVHGENLSLGMRRLSIIDVEGGAQPIANEDETVWTVFNGEIYNYRALRTTLEDRGHRFSTDADTEVLVHGFEEWGRSLVSKLNGMFAFAVWDRDGDEVVVARDRLGIKPLYLTVTDRAVVFASELSALLANGAVSAAIDRTALMQYYTLRYVPAPRTILSDVTKLEPGTVATISTTDPSLEARSYWSLDRTGHRDTTLRSLLESAVDQRLIADVPLGAFLSGGLDSTAIVGLMDDLSADPVSTFSMGFANADYDESPFSRRVAEDFGTDHHELTVDPEAMQIFDDVVARLDEPMADPATIPTYLLSEFAREHVKVVLSGEGSDELFAGYDHLRRRLGWWDDHSRYPAIVYVVADALHRLAPTGTTPARYLRHLAGHRDQRAAFAASLVREYQCFDFSQAEALAAVRRCIDAVFDSEEDYARNLLRFEQRYPLPDNMLFKMDRMSMAHSLEARVPFLDHRIVEHSNAIEARRHYAADAKPILRRAVDDVVPDYVLERDKHGFQVPIEEWLSAPLPEIEAIFDPPVLSTVPHVDVDRTRALYERHKRGRATHTRILWRTLLYAKWYTHHVENR